MATSLLDDPALDKCVNDAIREAIAGTFAAGRPITRDMEGVVCKEYPDGHVEPVKKNMELAPCFTLRPRSKIRSVSTKPDQAAKRKQAV